MINFARFGSKTGAHDVLQHSGVDSRLLGEIIWRTDAPPESSGLGLEPFFSAFRHGDVYVVQVTRADPSAGRPGMVVTTSALVPLEDLRSLNIQELLRVLWDVDLDCTRAIDLLDLRQSNENVHFAFHWPGAAAVATALLNSGRTVWTGPDLENVVACLWWHLSFEDRRRLVIGSAARPNALTVPLSSGSLAIIASSAAVVGRWVGWPVASSESVAVEDATRDALFGDDGGAGASLASELEMTSMGLGDCRFLARALPWLRDASDLDHERCRSLLQIFGELQPDRSLGTRLKQSVLDTLRMLTVDASFSDIRGLRSIPWEAIDDDGFPELLECWALNVTSDAAKVDLLLSGIIELHSGRRDEFLEHLEKSLLCTLPGPVLLALVNAALEHIDGACVIPWLASSTLASEDLDRALATALGQSPVAPDWLEIIVHDLGLPLSYAWSASLKRPIDAWVKQLEFTPRSSEAEDILAARMGLASVVDAALALDDPSLTTRAATAVARDGTLLDEWLIGDSRFRAVWFEAVSRGADPWLLVEPARACVDLLDLVVGGDAVEPAVLVALSKTTAADITDYSSRASVWSRLPSDALPGFLSATAQTLVRSIRPGDPSPEVELERAMLMPESIKSVARESPSQAIVLLNLRSASEADAIRVVESGRLAPAEAFELATLLVARRWRGAAERMVSLGGSQANLGAAVSKASELFSPMERLMRTFTGHSRVSVASATDLRSVFVDVAADLYPLGPNMDGLWERAGGSGADVLTGQTGRLAWGHAIDSSLDGRRGVPRPYTLLSTILEDYPRNPQILALKSAYPKSE